MDILHQLYLNQEISMSESHKLINTDFYSHKKNNIILIINEGISHFYRIHNLFLISRLFPCSQLLHHHHHYYLYTFIIFVIYIAIQNSNNSHFVTSITIIMLLPQDPLIMDSTLSTRKNINL